MNIVVTGTHEEIANLVAIGAKNYFTFPIVVKRVTLYNTTGEGTVELDGTDPAAVPAVTDRGLLPGRPSRELEIRQPFYKPPEDGRKIAAIPIVAPPIPMREMGVEVDTGSTTIMRKLPEDFNPNDDNPDGGIHF